MPTIKFDDFLKEQLKDPKFREGYYEEQAKLEALKVLEKKRKGN